MKVLVEVPRELLPQVFALLDGEVRLEKVEPAADPAQMDLPFDPVVPVPVMWSGKPKDTKVTIADLEAALTTYYKREGLPAAKAVLAEFGAARVGEVPGERWGELMERLK